MLFLTFHSTAKHSDNWQRQDFASRPHSKPKNAATTQIGRKKISSFKDDLDQRRFERRTSRMLVDDDVLQSEHSTPELQAPW